MPALRPAPGPGRTGRALVRRLSEAPLVHSASARRPQGPPPGGEPGAGGGGGPGSWAAPLVRPGPAGAGGDGVPLGVELELQRAADAAGPPAVQAEALDPGCYHLQYVLQGEGSVALAPAAAATSNATSAAAAASALALKAGDAIVYPPGTRARLPVAVAPGGELASLVLRLPPLDSPAEEAAEAGEAADWFGATSASTSASGSGSAQVVGRARAEAILRGARRGVPRGLRRRDAGPEPEPERQHGWGERERAGLDRRGVLVEALGQAQAYQLPGQGNRLALVFDPVSHGLPFTFGVEIFPPGHVTPLHVHSSAHELFFILDGRGVVHCEGEEAEVGAGDLVIFPPGARHGIDNRARPGGDRLYCLELMAPNEMFAELVRGGDEIGLDVEDLCALLAVGCDVSNAPEAWDPAR